jgi:hypothetical protein
VKNAAPKAGHSFGSTRLELRSLAKSDHARSTSPVAPSMMGRAGSATYPMPARSTVGEGRLIRPRN